MASTGLGSGPWYADRLAFVELVDLTVSSEAAWQLHAKAALCSFFALALISPHDPVHFAKIGIEIVRRFTIMAESGMLEREQQSHTGPTSRHIESHHTVVFQQVVAL